MVGRNKLKDTAGQVAVEFILMFIIVAFIIFYIWRLSLSLAALQIREYATFMVGRAITASYETDAEKANRASQVMEMYNGSDGFAVSDVIASPLYCNITGNGNRAVWGNTGELDWDSVSDTGVACGIMLNSIMPVGAALPVVSESMTWSEISDAHCRCALQFDKMWKDCLRSDGDGKYTDNHC
jgi:hypothetical protein